MPPESADKIVHDFIDKEGGVIVYLSDDVVFTRALRNIVSRVIGLRGETLLPFSSMDAAMKKMRGAARRRGPLAWSSSNGSSATARPRTSSSGSNGNART